MTEKKLCCSRIIENFDPPYPVEELTNKIRESVADAFLAQVEYGKIYVVKTKFEEDDLANGFGTKYTYSLRFDELVQCKDCKHWNNNTYLYGCKLIPELMDPNFFCEWGEKVVE